MAQRGAHVGTGFLGGSIAVGGAHEYALRLPSVMGIALASWFMYRLVKRLIDEDSALPAVAVFIGLQPVVFTANGCPGLCADTRPGDGIDSGAGQLVGNRLARIRGPRISSRRRSSRRFTISRSRSWECMRCTRWPVREGSPVTWRQTRPGRCRRGNSNRAYSPRCPSGGPASPVPCLFETSPIDGYGGYSGAIRPGLRRGARGAAGLDGLPQRAVVPASVRGSTLWLLLALTAGTVFFFFAVSNILRTSVFLERYMIASTAGLARLAVVISAGYGPPRRGRSSPAPSSSARWCRSAMWAGSGLYTAARLARRRAGHPKSLRLHANSGARAEPFRRVGGPQREYARLPPGAAPRISASGRVIPPVRPQRGQPVLPRNQRPPRAGTRGPVRAPDLWRR